MKALNQLELQTFVDVNGPLLRGAQLQDVVSNDRGLALGFRKQRHYWLVIDLLPNTPMLLLFPDHSPFKKASKAKPLGLFLNSHGKNLFLTDLEIKSEYGRVLRLHLQNSQKKFELELRLIPRQANILGFCEGKSVAWDKPLELKPAPILDYVPEERTQDQIKNEWLESGHDVKKTSDPREQWEQQKNKNLHKKRQALEALQKQINEGAERLWLEAGEWLKSHGSEVSAKEIPEHLKPCINREESLGWNMEQCFAKAKQILKKQEGAQLRMKLLHQEIQDLEQQTYSQEKIKAPLPDLMKKAVVKGRKLVLKSGALAYCGKSARDNLNLLRQAKAWDYWLHLKDYPGAHGILHRHRDQIISQAEFMQVAEWVARESLPEGSLRAGQKLAVVVVEVRFVRPIKGDKLGRVTYHSERTLSLTLRQG